MLSVLRELIHFRQDDDTKVALSTGIDDIRLSDLLDDICDYNAIIDAGVRWINWKISFN